MPVKNIIFNSDTIQFRTLFLKILCQINFERCQVLKHLIKRVEPIILHLINEKDALKYRETTINYLAYNVVGLNRLYFLIIIYHFSTNVC